MKQFKIILKGEVQGVFFRAFVKKEAERLNLKGYTKNMYDGDLKVVVQGAQKDLIEMVDICKQGSDGARIDKVILTEEPIEETYTNFEIKH